MRIFAPVAAFLGLMLLPSMALAASAGVSFKEFVTKIINALNTVVVPLIFSFAFVFFLYGVFRYFFLSADSDKGRQEARTFVLWGIVALAVMFSTWGLVRVFMNTFGL